MQLDIQDFFADFEVPPGASPVDPSALVYSYDDTVTPCVESISRLNGTTAGGTTVVLTGKGFVPNATTVLLNGIVCSTEYSQIGSYRGLHLCEWDLVECGGLGVTPTEITCLTNPWDYSDDAFHGDVTVNVPTGDAVVDGSVDWSYMNLWSSTTTWGGNDPPVSGDSVVVTYGEFIVLDVSPPSLYLLTLQGLSCSPRTWETWS